MTVVLPQLRVDGISRAPARQPERVNARLDEETGELDDASVLLDHRGRRIIAARRCGLMQSAQNSSTLSFVWTVQKLFPTELQQREKLACQAGRERFSADKHLNFESPFHPDSSNTRQVVGVACMMVAPLCSSNCMRRRPSIVTSRDATTSLPPTSSGRYISNPAISNERVVTATGRHWQ